MTSSVGYYAYVLEHRRPIETRRSRFGAVEGITTLWDNAATRE